MAPKLKYKLLLLPSPSTEQELQPLKGPLCAGGNKYCIHLLSDPETSSFE